VRTAGPLTAPYPEDAVLLLEATQADGR